VALVRPSELARVWELHPKTVYLWIREGRLPAIKTPGAQYRVREGDVRAYCEKNGLPLPRELARPEKAAARIAVIGRPGATFRALSRACKASGVELRSFASALDGFLAIASDVPSVVALDARSCGVKVSDALRALRRADATAGVPVVVYDAATKPAPLVKLGATSVFGRGDDDEVAQTIVSLAAERDAARAPTPPRAAARRGRG
jgi:excisionase family DNA binding protein